MFELLLSRDSLLNVWDRLKVHHLGAIVFMGKHRPFTAGVLVYTAFETTGNADVKDTIRIFISCV